MNGGGWKVEVVPSAKNEKHVWLTALLTVNPMRLKIYDSTGEIDLIRIHSIEPAKSCLD
jgi:hypothetical protein